MLDHPAVSVLRELVILAGVVLLGAAVFHPVVLWTSLTLLALGIALLLGACIQAWRAGGASAGPGVPRGPEVRKEG